MAKPNLPKLPTPVETKPTTPSAQATTPQTRPTTLGNTPVTSGTVTLNTPKNTAPDAEISPIKPGGAAATTGSKPNLPTLPNTGSTGGTATGGKPNLPTLPSSGGATTPSGSNPIAEEVQLNNGGLTGSSNFDPATDTGLLPGMVAGMPTTLPVINPQEANKYNPVQEANKYNPVQEENKYNPVQEGNKANILQEANKGTPSSEQAIIAGTGLNPGMMPTLPASPQQIISGTGINPGMLPTLPTIPQPAAPSAPTAPSFAEQFQQWQSENPTLPGTNANSAPGKPQDLQEVTPQPTTPTPSNVSSNLPTNLVTPPAAINPETPVTLPTTGDQAGGKPDLPPLPTLPAPNAPAVPGGNTGGTLSTEVPQYTPQTQTPTATPEITLPSFNQLNAPEFAAPELSNPTFNAVTAPEYQFNGITLPEFNAQGMPTAPEADTAAMRAQLEQWQNAVNQQNENRVNYATQQAVADLQRAQEDAQLGFKEQAEAVARDERQGMDNAALYAQARGDKGGIGMAQYNEIQAAAAQNRLAVQQQQSKLSTDTARQIADLRAKGEFEKADAALEVAQTYLAKLTQLEQWAAEYGMSAAQFNAQMAQWQNEFNFAMDQYRTDAEKWNAQMEYQQMQDKLNLDKWNAQMQYQQQQDALANERWQTEFAYGAEQDKLALEKWNKQMQYQLEQDLANIEKWGAEFGYTKEQDALANKLKEKSQLVNMGAALLEAGVMPSDQQLGAMGISQAQAKEWIIAAQMREAAKQESQQSSPGVQFQSTNDMYQALKGAGVTTAEAAKATLTMWGIPNPGNYSDAYTQWYRTNKDGGGTSGAITQDMYTALDSINDTAGDGYKEKMILYISGLNISDADKVKLAQAYGL